MKRIYLTGAIAVMGATLLVQGCKHDENAMRQYNIEIANLSNNQPFSPPAVILHKSGYHGFTPGTMASEGLEQLAESGDNTAFISTAQASAAYIGSSSGSDIIPPGNKTSIQVSGFGYPPRLTLASMLVNTNDGFIGINGVQLGTLGMNESLVLHARVYDSGTEANLESAATIPGPAGGGEGYNATRDDRDFIAVHPGVVSVDDGLASSVLTSSHRFDNPGARIVITRLQ